MEDQQLHYFAFDPSDQAIPVAAEAIIKSFKTDRTLVDGSLIALAAGISLATYAGFSANDVSEISKIMHDGFIREHGPSGFKAEVASAFNAPKG